MVEMGLGKGEGRGGARQAHPKCSFCQQDHYSDSCPEFLDLPTNNERYDLVRKKDLCKVCFKAGHKIDNCFKLPRQGPCRVMTGDTRCDKNHHMMIHRSTQGLCAATFSHGPASSKVLFPVQRVQVRGAADRATTINDMGSNTNMVTIDFAERNSLKKLSFDVNLALANGATAKTTTAYVVPLVDVNGHIHEISAVAMPVIGECVSSFPTKEAAKAFSMKEEEFDNIDNKRIDLLLGFNSVRIVPKERDRTNSVILFSSVFGTGWVTQGVPECASQQPPGRVYKVTGVAARIPSCTTTEELGVDVEPKHRTAKWSVKPALELGGESPRPGRMSATAARVVMVKGETVCDVGNHIDVSRFQTLRMSKKILGTVLLTLYRFRNKRLAMVGVLTKPSFNKCMRAAELLIIHSYPKGKVMQLYTEGKLSSLRPFLTSPPFCFPIIEGFKALPLVEMRGRGGTVKAIALKTSSPVLSADTPLARLGVWIVWLFGPHGCKGTVKTRATRTGTGTNSVWVAIFVDPVGKLNYIGVLTGYSTDAFSRSKFKEIESCQDGTTPARILVPAMAHQQNPD